MSKTIIEDDDADTQVTPTAHQQHRQGNVRLFLLLHPTHASCSWCFLDFIYYCTSSIHQSIERDHVSQEPVPSTKKPFSVNSILLPQAIKRSI